MERRLAGRVEQVRFAAVQEQVLTGHHGALRSTQGPLRYSRTQRDVPKVCSDTVAGADLSQGAGKDKDAQIWHSQTWTVTDTNTDTVTATVIDTITITSGSVTK